VRPDFKPEGPRQAMSWLHTWSGLILGWLLFAIFLTGTLSFFHQEITAWMKPELHRSVPPPDPAQQARIAVDYLQKRYPDAGSWTIQLPNERSNVTVVTVRGQDEDPRARRGGTRITLDSATGEPLASRDTRGGAFLFRFHFELYGLPRIWARWIVGVATLFMFVAIISGIITHKKIFADFFTFRPGKGQRSWMDAHNATAVLALPFHIMITFSGLLLLMFTIMPWGVNQVYQNRLQFLQDQARTVAPVSQDSGRGGARRAAGAPARLADLGAIVADAGRAWQGAPIGSISVIAPNTARAQVEVRALHGTSVAARFSYPILRYDGLTGARLPEHAAAPSPPAAVAVYNALITLHEGRGVDIALRWLLFLSGIVGSAMVASGLVLWCVKRLPQQQKRGAKSFGYRFVEAANAAAIAGLAIACAAFFYANRLLPADMAGRADYEIHAFFIAWLAALAYACVRPARQAWLGLLATAGAAYAVLPVLNPLTGGRALWDSIVLGQWAIASFDLACMAFAVLFAFIFCKLRRHGGIAARKDARGGMLAEEAA